MNLIYTTFKFLILSSLLLLSSLPGHAQEVVDHLHEKFTDPRQSDTQKLDISSKYLTALFSSGQTSKAQEVFTQSIKMAEKQPDTKYLANLYAIRAINYRISEDNLKSESTLEKALEYAKASKDSEIKGYLAYTQGWIYARDNKEGEAVRSFLQALNYYESSSVSATLNARKATVYKELTTIYANWNELELQEKYARLSLELAKAQKDPLALFDAYMLMGFMYENRFLHQTSELSLRDSAEKYYLLAIDTYKDNQKDIPFASHLSYVSINLANLYLGYYPDSYNDKATYYANVAKKQGIESKVYTHVASAYGILAEIALKQNNTKQAKDHLLQALTEISKNDFANQSIILSIYESLSEIAESEGNLQQALNFQKAYLQTYKTIHNQDQIELGRRLEAQFDKERQQQRLHTMTLEAQQQQQELNLVKALRVQQNQEFENLKLYQENQSKQLELSELESEKKAQELKLSQIQAKSRSEQILNYQNEITYKEQLNTYYIVLIFVFALVVILLLYGYQQRSKTLKQNKELYNFTLDKERQNTKIATLTAMLDGQEKERGRIARDLHDGLGGLLSSTKIQLSILTPQIPEPMEPDFKKSVDQLDFAVEELRRVAHNLMPDLLNRYGLLEALKDYADRMSNEKVSITTEFLHLSDPIDKDKQLLIYRIIQELVNNAVKHAKASSVLIQIVQEPEQYCITIEDDGVGFEPDKVQGNHSTGLFNIQSRIDFLKGHFQVHSEIGVGTSIEISIPKLTIS